MCYHWFRSHFGSRFCVVLQYVWLLRKQLLLPCHSLLMCLVEYLRWVLTMTSLPDWIRPSEKNGRRRRRILSRRHHHLPRLHHLAALETAIFLLCWSSMHNRKQRYSTHSGATNSCSMLVTNWSPTGWSPKSRRLRAEADLDAITVAIPGASKLLGRKRWQRTLDEKGSFVVAVCCVYTLHNWDLSESE